MHIHQTRTTNKACSLIKLCYQQQPWQHMETLHHTQTNQSAVAEVASNIKQNIAEWVSWLSFTTCFPVCSQLSQVLFTVILVFFYFRFRGGCMDSSEEVWRWLHGITAAPPFGQPGALHNTCTCVNYKDSIMWALAYYWDNGVDCKTQLNQNSLIWGLCGHTKRGLA